MKTKTAVTLTLLMCVATAAVMLAATLTNRQVAEEAPRAPRSAQVTTVAVPTVVSPTFDMEATSPAAVHDDAMGSLDELIEVPTPELTWYAPQAMHDVAGIS